MAPLALLNIGPFELVLMAAAAILLFGGDLPDVARKAARAMAKLRSLSSDLTRELQRSDDFRPPPDLQLGSSERMLPLPRNRPESGVAPAPPPGSRSGGQPVPPFEREGEVDHAAKAGDPTSAGGTEGEPGRRAEAGEPTEQPGARSPSTWRPAAGGDRDTDEPAVDEGRGDEPALGGGSHREEEPPAKASAGPG